MTNEFPDDQIPMLYGRRRRREMIEHEEAQDVSFWTDQLDQQTRARLYQEVQILLDTVDWLDIASFARLRTLREEGLVKLSDDIFSTDDRKDLLNGILERPEQVVFSLIEAIVSLPRFVDMDPHTALEYDLFDDSDIQMAKPFFSRFGDNIRRVLREQRISFDLIEGCFVPLQSFELYEAIVVPTLTLLGNHSRLSSVEAAYQTALNELSSGSPEDAITDAATALQEALVSLGCEGNSLGRLVINAKKKGIMASYDEILIRSMIDWVSADRSTKGDAHNAEPAAVEDAWLTVHVVGALILRIMSGPLRNKGVHDDRI